MSQKRCWEMILTMWAVLPLCVGASTASAQPNTNLVLRYSAVWKYDASGRDLGVAWRVRDYNDSAWPTAPGVFAYPLYEVLAPEAVAHGALNRTLLPLYTSSGIFIRTFYFRVHFDLAPPVENRLLLLTNVLDDGAVYYLNGQEVHRENMPPGIITASTPAPTFRVEPVTPVVFFVGASNLLAGDNVLAVEVHQNGTLSSDVVFGLTLAALVGSAPEISRQPAHLIVEEDKAFTLSVTASGEPITYRWQHAAPGGLFTNVPDAVTSSYTVARAQAADAGSYRVVVENFVDSITSRIAQVQVVPDRAGPALVSATADHHDSAWSVALIFSESVDFFTGRQSANYALQELTTGTNLPVSVSGFPQGPRVVLQTASLDPGARYVVTVNGVKDRKNNVIAPGSQAPVVFTRKVILVAMDQVWRWSEEDQPLPVDWRANHLDPWLHGEGRALFHNSLSRFEPCQGEATTFISLGPRTYYFTTRFEAPPTPAAVQLQMVQLVDDGAVFHLNGFEIARYNMPTGEVYHATLCAEPIRSAGCVTNYLNVTNLLTGSNTLAVEVHAQAFDDDVVFGLELSGDLPLVWTLPATAPPHLTCKPQGSQALLSWTGGGYALEAADQIDGPWTEVQPMTNPSTNNLPISGNRFWRLHRTQP